MKIKIRGKDLVFAAIYLQILYSFLPIIRALPFAVRLIFRAGPVALLFLAALIRRSFWRKYIILNVFAVFIAIVRSLVYANGIEESIATNIMYSVMYWSCVIEGVYALSYFDGNDARKLFRTALILIGISSISSIIGTILFPRAIRSTVSFLVEEFAYYKYNIGAYSYVYAIVFMLIPLFYLFKMPEERKNIADKRLLAVIIFEVAVNIILSQFMAAIIVALLSVVALLKTKNIRRLAIVLAAIVFAIYLFTEPVGLLLARIAEFAGNRGYHDLHERFNGLSRLLIVGNAYGDIGARISLYRISISHFLQNPLFGLIGVNGFRRATFYKTVKMLDIGIPSMVNSVGQHSDIVDLLGGGGIICFIPFILVIRYYWKSFRAYIKSSTLLRFSFIGLLQYLLYGVVDHSFSCVDVALVVFVLVPLLSKLGDGVSEVDPAE